MTSHALPFAIALLLATAPACGPLESDLCDFKCDCAGCDDHQFDDCVHKYDDDYRAAEREGCEDRYDALLACEDDTGRCDGREWHTSCKAEKDDFKKCVDK